MRRAALVLATVLLTAALIFGGVETALAQPDKNQITVPASCSNGQDYTLVINAMGVAGQLPESTSNVIIPSYTVTYFNPDTGQQVGSPVTKDQGNKKGVQGDQLTCTGTTTTTLVGLGTVTAVYDFQAFVTPRGSR